MSLSFLRIIMSVLSPFVAVDLSSSLLQALDASAALAPFIVSKSLQKQHLALIHEAEDITVDHDKDHAATQTEPRIDAVVIAALYVGVKEVVLDASLDKHILVEKCIALLKKEVNATTTRQRAFITVVGDSFTIELDNKTVLFESKKQMLVYCTQSRTNKLFFALITRDKRGKFPCFVFREDSEAQVRPMWGLACCSCCYCCRRCGGCFCGCGYCCCCCCS
jgi:hypothetical protein